MFAYCLNNPVQYVDFDGNASFWYFLIIDSDFGFIHRMVQREIALKYNVSKELWVSKGGEKVGRVDIMRSNGSIWEVKHGTNNPIVRKARMIAAKWQAEQYLGAKADRNDVAASNLGEVGAFSGSSDTYLWVLCSFPPRYRNSSQLPRMLSHCFSNRAFSWEIFWRMMDTKTFRERMVARILSKSSGKLTLANSSIRKCTGMGSAPPYWL